MKRHSDLEAVRGLVKSNELGCVDVMKQTLKRDESA